MKRRNSVKNIVKFLALALTAAMHNLHASSPVPPKRSVGGCGDLAATFNSPPPPPFSTQIVNLPPQFTDIKVDCNTNANALCATTLNVTDSTVVMDNTIPGEYTNLNDYNFLRANRSIFPTFDNELVLTPTFTVPSGGGFPAGNHFGAAVAISGDGSIIAIGSTSFNPALLQRVDIYRRQGNTWVATQILLPPVANSQYFGSSLAMSYDGLVLAVGNPKNSFLIQTGSSSATSFGYIAMYVYDSVAKSYVLNQIIPGSALAAFGTALKLSATGQYLITNEDSVALRQVFPPTFTNITALIYVRSNTCDTACNTTAAWALQARLIARDNSGQPFSGGISVVDAFTFTQHTTISADGETAVLGWVLDSTGSGMIAIFKRHGTTWQQIQFINGSPGNGLGVAVSLSTDGSYLATANYFSATVIILKQSGPLYVQEQSITLPNDPRSLSLSADGSVLAIGTGQSSFDTNDRDGIVLIALRGPDGIWSRPFIKSAPTNSLNDLGASIACSADGNFVVAGAPGTNNFQGAVSIFRPVGSFIPNDTVVTGSLCVYNRTIINDALNTGVALKVRGNIHVNGTIVTGTAGHVTPCAANLSDERIKDDIKPLDPQEALDTLRKLLPVKFSWRNSQNPHPFDTPVIFKKMTGTQGERAVIDKRECGFVADNMEIVFPQFVWQRPATDEEAPFIIDGKTKNILIRAELYAYLIAALEKLVERNQRRNEELRELIQEPKEKLANACTIEKNAYDSAAAQLSIQ